VIFLVILSAKLPVCSVVRYQATTLVMSSDNYPSLPRVQEIEAVLDTWQGWIRHLTSLEHS